MHDQPGPYGLLARLVLAHRRAVGLVVGLLVLLSAVVALPPNVDPNLLELLPDDDPSVQALRALQREEGGTNLVTLSFASDDPERLDAVLDELVVELEGLDRVRWALHDLDEDLATRIGLLQLDPEEVSELSARLKGALALGPALNPLVTQKLLAMGPLTEKMGQAGRAAPFADDEGRARLILKPTGASADIPFAVALMHDLGEVLDAQLADEEGVELLWVGGAYRHAVEDFEGIQQDMVWTTAASLALVLLVIGFTFRGWRAPLLVFVPLIAANVVTLALVHLLLGSLNTYTSFGTAILIGLGIDFAVHLVGRYREFRSSGHDVDDAVVRAWDKTGPPCTTASLTSAAGFVALAVANFEGFAQLGLMLALGLMVCLLFMLVLLPALIPTLAPEPVMLRGSAVIPISTRSTYRGAPIALMLMVLFTGLVGASRIPELRWEYDFSALRRDGLAYDELGAAERALARESYSPVVLSFPDPRSLAKAQARVERLMDEGELTHVARAISVQSVLPPDQALRIAALQEVVEQLDHPNLRYLPPPLVQELLPLKGRELEAVQREELPQALLDMLGGGREGEHRLLLFPQGNMWDLREAEKLTAEVERALPQRQAAGEYISLGSLYRTIQRDMPLVGALALLMVTLLTAIDLKRLHWTVGAIGTLLAGMTWAAAAVEAVGVKLSMLNVVGIPILLGIGVDVVIHLAHRLRDEGPGGVRRALATTGVAASISTFTTVLSFASLTLAGNRGVRSLGLLVVIGLITVFAASAVLLPTAWAAGWKVTGRAPADRAERGRRG